MQIRHTDRSRYFREQEYTTNKYVIPFIGKVRPIHSGMRILEIGCGEGGNLLPFLHAGCLVTGIDLSENKIILANKFFADHPSRANLELICEDIYRMEIPVEKYDVVIMRDVIEHIHEQSRFMRFVRHFMNPGSLFFLAFPPWQNPFGGHQQVCRNRILSHLPYFHLLPVSIYRGVLGIMGESAATVENLLEVKETGISIERFERILHESQFRVLSKAHFFINPNYEVKFGLKPVKQAFIISRIPWFRNFLTTSVYYLISPGREANGQANLQD